MSIPWNNVDPLKGVAGYERVGLLGQGAFGGVILYKRTLADGSKDEVAVKFIGINETLNFKLVEREVCSQRMLLHPHVIQLKRLGISPDLRYLYMVLEYAKDGDLFSYINKRHRLSEHEARWFFQQLIFGLDYCHKRGIVSRDLKPENLLLSRNPFAQSTSDSPANYHLKIADFGLSKAGFNSMPKSRVGTITYMAPEVLLAGSGRTYDGELADVWSCGVVLYVMLFGKYPFTFPENQNNATEWAAAMKKLVNGLYETPSNVRVSQPCLDLLSKLMQPLPNKRVTCAEVMAHPWFMEGLPPAAITRNTDLVNHQLRNPPPWEQTWEEVLQVLMAAQDAPQKNQKTGGGKTDGFDDEDEVPSMYDLI
uniref:Protein kinase domain-containing protein n=1 Tax=Polytomella parva TaxID=51329 RepID=A0A7S0Y9W3_9CHLO|mmetsp:Transcript_11933/g.21402  ORF Transcript_11933/g.21402 Transcript_11933/m.21402 type:complete len:366 (+) Transcript_11933:124-1221(+)|eukprot:CAMPEP_0175064838 /NCGR_PEP_ID=MMETSP0052_2-20121109/15570_1 /TAXON_ID=51329 ORGANISM="Polytomella parva, Strain SAG 63-3" /NCGR_SAMPLE_ID=MMETSP0052_2 /ASSEMBLY_ACC=CAM_ASM_000194 /LENGTH=365 /DNA_ID=CAMNT_0016331263 /DNA_START=87 /DNA_END=1184 /DNA_ORIENTATION=-